MVKRYQLRGHSGPVANRVIELVELNITLGRDLSNDIVIGDSEVSRNHAAPNLAGRWIHDSGPEEHEWHLGQRQLRNASFQTGGRRYGGRG